MKKIIYLILPIILFSCEKEQTINPFPVIEFISISPAIAQQYSDKITIVIKYTDEDGDLGENNPDVTNLFVKDIRNGIQYEYRIPQLAANENEIFITGNFNILINGSGITNGSSSEKVSYEIYVEDRSNNESNTITTSEITIQQ